MTDTRVVVADDNLHLELVIYAGADMVTHVSLDPLGAALLGNQLVAAGLRHLSRSADKPAQVAPVSAPRRGGDPHAELRRERDEGLRELGLLVAPSLSAKAQAQAVHDRLTRYRPSPGETAPERLTMARILETGLGVPSVDRLKRILSGGEQRVSKTGVCLPPDRA